MDKCGMSIQRADGSWFGGTLRYETLEEARQEARRLYKKCNIKKYRLYKLDWSPFDGYTFGDMIEQGDFREGW